jgi:hypothetical protein
MPPTILALPQKPFVFDMRSTCIFSRGPTSQPLGALLCRTTRIDGRGEDFGPAIASAAAFPSNFCSSACINQVFEAIIIPTLLAHLFLKIKLRHKVKWREAQAIIVTLLSIIIINTQMKIDPRHLAAECPSP